MAKNALLASNAELPDIDDILKSRRASAEPSKVELLDRSIIDVLQNGEEGEQFEMRRHLGYIANGSVGYYHQGKIVEICLSHEQGKNGLLTKYTVEDLFPKVNWARKRTAALSLPAMRAAALLAYQAEHKIDPQSGK